MKRLLPLLVLAACAEQPNDAVIAYYMPPGECPEGGCGTNAGFVLGVPFADLNLLGAANDEGTTFVDYEVLPDDADALDVEKNELVALDGGVRVARGIELKDTRFIVNIDGVDMRIKIHEVHPQAAYWARNDVDGWRLYTYRIGYQLASASHTSPYTDLCVPDNESGWYAWDAVIFEGERYNATTKHIQVAPGAGWFNIACLRGAAAKALMFRHAWASSYPSAVPAQNIVTTHGQRQALVNAITANYCGDGKTWTETGHLLRYRDSKDWITDPKWTWTTEAGVQGSEIASYEGIFNHDGAACLNNPRKFTTSTEKNNQLWAEIQDHCKSVGHPEIPRCSPGNTLPVGWQALGHVLTANPLPKK